MYILCSYHERWRDWPYETRQPIFRKDITVLIPAESALYFLRDKKNSEFISCFTKSSFSKNKAIFLMKNSLIFLICNDTVIKGAYYVNKRYF